jgi:MFS family permease
VDRRLTIAFAAGQIVGPSLAGWVADLAGGLRAGLACSAGVLLLAAIAASRQKPTRACLSAPAHESSVTASPLKGRERPPSVPAPRRAERKARVAIGLPTKPVSTWSSPDAAEALTQPMTRSPKSSGRA